MSYQLTADENVTTGLRRCARERVDRAIKALELDHDADPGKAIHTARKSLKQERSLLRLSRAALPRRVRRVENRAFAQIARGLSDERDAAVMAKTFDSLAAEDRSLSAAKRRSVRQALIKPADDGAAAAGAASQAAQALALARERIEQWPLQRGGWKALEPGLERTIRRGRKAFRRAQDDPSAENLHSWRKRVKDLWYHLRVLAEVGGPAVGGQAKEASHLSDLLGEDHDLAVLHERLTAPALSGAPVAGILDLIDTRRQRLRAEAFVVGERLYSEKPKAFRQRLRRSWQTGRRLSKLQVQPEQNGAPGGTGASSPGRGNGSGVGKGTAQAGRTRSRKSAAASSRGQGSTGSSSRSQGSTASSGSRSQKTTASGDRRGQGSTASSGSRSRSGRTPTSRRRQAKPKK